MSGPTPPEQEYGSHWSGDPMPPPPQQQPVYVPAGTNGLAIASLVLGIVWLFWLGSILALVFGYIAKAQIDRSGGAETGRGLAIAGIVLGWVGVATFILVVLGGACTVSTGGGGSDF